MTNLDYVEIEIIVEKTHHSLKKTYVLIPWLSMSPALHSLS